MAGGELSGGVQIWYAQISLRGRFSRADASLDAPSAAHSYSRLIVGNVLSDTSIVQMQRWIRDCPISCNRIGIWDLQPAVRKLPRRLLFIGDESSPVRLVEQLASLVELPLGHLPDYVALSYCWGGNQLMTLRKNLASHSDGIPLAKLSKTVQDAILLLRRLSISYLWVDCLCIVQDDKEEVTDEITKMASYYGNATFTLSIAESESCQTGFLDNSSRHWANAIHFSVPVQWGLDEQYLVEFELLTPGILTERAIDRRAWTLQEGLLSPRVLTIGHSRAEWSCAHAQRGHHPNESLRRAVRRFPERWRTESNTLETFHALLCLWYRIVLNYMSRQITLPEDRLSALSSLALILTTPDSIPYSTDYCLGLWRKHLAIQLLWSTKRKYSYSSTSHLEVWSISDWPPEGLFPEKIRRYTDNGFPSWSWAAVDGIVSTGHWLGNDQDDRESLHSALKAVNKTVEVVSCQGVACDSFTRLVTTPRPDSKAWTQLCLKARYRPAPTSFWWTCLSGRVSPLQQQSITAMEVVQRERHGLVGTPHLYPGKLIVQLDTDDDLEDYSNAVRGKVRAGFLEIMPFGCQLRKDSTGSTPKGLFIIRNDDGTYRRIGTFFALASSSPNSRFRETFFEGCNLQELTLV
jgi:Heterokaryon incompatibility protein (HET)